MNQAIRSFASPSGRVQLLATAILVTVAGKSKSSLSAGITKMVDTGCSDGPSAEQYVAKAGVHFENARRLDDVKIRRGLSVGHNISRQDQGRSGHTCRERATAIALN